MRLIDADKLFEVLNKKSVPYRADVNDAILTAPAIELIHCRDCKYWSGEGEWNEPECTKWDLSYGGRISVDDDDYCSYAERKETDETDRCGR